MTMIEKDDHHHDHDQSGVTLMWCDNDGQVCLYISIMTMIITVMMIMTMITPAMMIKTMITTAMMNRCDCDSLAADPDSFCSNGEVCKVSVLVIVIFACDQDKSYFETNAFICSTNVQDCVCGPRFPPGCECDPYSNDPGQVACDAIFVMEL